MTTLADILTAETVDDARSALLAQLVAASFPVTDWEEGGVARTLVELDAQVNADFSERQIEITKGVFLSLAVGAWKDLVAEEFYGITRHAAERTVGPERFYCANTAGPYSIVIGQIWVSDSVGRRYCNTEAGTLPQGTTIAAGSNGLALPQATIYVASTSGFPTSGTIYIGIGSTKVAVAYTGVTGTTFTGCTGGTGTLATGQVVYGTIELDVQAEAAGSDYNALPNTITTMVTVLPGVTCTNPGTGAWPTTPGTDEETDVLLEDRCVDQWSTLGYGQNDDWFAYWARTGHEYAASVTKVRVDTDTTGGGIVTVTLAGPSGAIGAGEVAVVDSWLREKLANTTKLVTQSAGEEPLDLVLDAYVEADHAAAYEASAESSVLAMLASLDIGATAYEAAQIEALMEPEGSINVVLTGGADVVPATTDVVVLHSITITVHSV